MAVKTNIMEMMGLHVILAFKATTDDTTKQQRLDSQREQVLPQNCLVDKIMC